MMENIERTPTEISKTGQAAKVLTSHKLQGSALKNIFFLDTTWSFFRGHRDQKTRLSSDHTI
jgi:hypothetical protein